MLSVSLLRKLPLIFFLYFNSFLLLLTSSSSSCGCWQTQTTLAVTVHIVRTNGNIHNIAKDISTNLNSVA